MPSKNTPSPLLAGSGKADLTPGMGIQLAGDIGRHRPAEWVEDPLFARALVLRQGEKTACLIALDLLAVTRPWSDRIRSQVADALGTRPDLVMVHALQPHSAPSLGHIAIAEDSRLFPPAYPWLAGGDDRYHAFAVERAVQAAVQACGNLTQVRVGCASGVEGRVAFNRRFVMRDGKVKTHPTNAHPSILHVEGPVDPELGILAFQGKGLGTAALLLNYTCHPTHGYPHRWVSADWPGVLAAEMDALIQSGGAAVVTNGFCGNIHHTNHLDPDWKDDFHRMGGILAGTARLILRRGLRFLEDPILDARSLRLRVPRRHISEEEVAAAKSLLAAHPEPVWMDEAKTAIRWDWVYALSRLDYYEETHLQPEYEMEIQVLRIGEVALVGFPGEPFVEGQLRLKLESPTAHTYALHMVNDCAGYIPTRRAMQGGGYETETARWSCLAPEALDCAVDAALGLLKEMYSI